MRAELDASLCIPKDKAITLGIDEIAVDARVSGTPSATISPIALELPTIAVEIPNVTLTLPAPTLSVKVNFGTTNALADYLSAMAAVLDPLTPNGLPPTDPADIAVLAAGILALPLGVAKALLAPSIEVDVTLNLGQAKITFDKPLTVQTGAFRLHGIANVPPITLGADFGNSGVAASLDPLKAALSGCLVLNGGDRPCGPLGEPRPTGPVPTVARVEKKGGATSTNVQLIIHGHGLGASQGTVSLRTPGIALSPTQYLLWSDTEVRAAFNVQNPGAYAATVTSATGITSDPIGIALP
jgi:hypothetical protein